MSSEAGSASQTGATRADLVRGAMNRLSALREAMRTENAGAIDQTSGAFAEQFGEALTAGEPIRLDVTSDHVRLGETDVLGGDLVALALLEGFEQEGLRAITLQPTTTRDELVALAMLLGRDWREKTSEDEALEAAAWGAAFGHIHLELAGADLRTEADQEELSPEELGVRLVRQLGVEGLSGGALEAEVGSLLDRLQRLDGGPVDDPGLAELKAQPEHRVLAAQLAATARGNDVTDDQVSRCFFETLRGAGSPQEAKATTQLIVSHARFQLEKGHPDVGVGLVRRLLVLGSADRLTDYRFKAEVQAGLRSLWSENGRAAIQAGIAASPDAEPWKGALFTLGELATAADMAGICELGASLDDPALRQPLADALLLLADRSGATLKQVLHDSHETALPVILLATRRRPDATLVEPLLARASSDNPRVREAVLLALRDHQSPRIKSVMRSAVADDAKPVRLEALRYLSVYRDEPAGEVVLGRLEGPGRAGALEEDELRALAMAWSIIRRAEGVSTLSRLAEEAAKGAVKERKAGGRDRHSRMLTALLHGLRAAGPPGRASIEALGRKHADLRGELRAILGGTR